MASMSKAELRKFLNKGTFTGKRLQLRRTEVHMSFLFGLSTIMETAVISSGSIYITTGSGSIKAENIQRDNRISLCVDYQTPPFSFVTINGIAKLHPYKEQEVLKWATKIAERYMGKKRAKSIGKRNSGEGSVLVQIEPTKIIAVKNITG